MFVWGFFLRPTRKFWLIWRRRHRRNWVQILTYRCMLGTHGHRAVRVLYHAIPTVTRVIRLYNGHLWGSVTLTRIAQRLAVELSLPLFMTKICRGWDSNTKSSTCEANALRCINVYLTRRYLRNGLSFIKKKFLRQWIYYFISSFTISQNHIHLSNRSFLYFLLFSISPKSSP